MYKYFSVAVAHVTRLRWLSKTPFTSYMPFLGGRKAMLLHCVIPVLITMKVVNCDMNLTHTQTLSEWRTVNMNYVLREMMARPLRGKQVIFMVEETLEDFVQDSFVLNEAVTPYVILSFPQHWKDADTELYHSFDFSKT